MTTVTLKRGTEKIKLAFVSERGWNEVKRLQREGYRIVRPRL